MSAVRVLFNNGVEYETEPGVKLSDIIKLAGFPMDFPCGGVGKCGQCKVNISAINGTDKQDVQQVLACSYKVSQDVWVELPEDLADRGSVILTTGAKTKMVVESGIGKLFVDGWIGEEDESSYWDKLQGKLKEKGITSELSLPILQQLSKQSANKKNKGVTVVTSGGKLIGIEAGDTGEACYGLAVDIGTTTVVGYLMDLSTGEEKAVAADLNGQRIYGADVISRINAAQQSAEKLKDLQHQVVKTINNIIDKLVQQTGISNQHIYSVTLAGNTCMHHLLLGLNPGNLGRAPFLPVIQREVEVKAVELGLTVNGQARIWVFPVIAGFVGGDTVSAVLASDFHKQKGKKLLVDIGTNGELVVTANGKMASCSAAAGPALEGAQISYGMRAEAGAISKVQLLPELDLEVIGNGLIKGICGSGLVDLMAELIKAGLIDYRGRFIPPDKYEGPESLKERVVKGEKGYSFELVKPEENQGKAIYFTQGDVSQLQLAKGALRAAMELLVKKVGMKGSEMEEFLLAGAFGNFLDIDKAHKIGLLPDWAKGKVRSIGNAAGEGAKIALLSRKKSKEVQEIVGKVDFLELAGTPDFQSSFTKGMLFDEAK